MIREGSHVCHLHHLWYFCFNISFDEAESFISISCYPVYVGAPGHVTG